MSQTRRDTIGGLIFLIVVCSIIAYIIHMINVTLEENQAYGLKYENKTCVLVVHKNELATCYFGSDKSPTTIDNYVELKGKNDLVDSFIQFLLRGDFEYER